MAKINITNEQNETIEVNGRMTFKISKVKDPETNKDIMVCFGQLATHKYFETITGIETDRYKLEGVDVSDEIFGTNDFNIVYEFSAEDWEIKEEYLSEEAIKRIEEEEYIDDEGDYYKAIERGDK